MKWKELLKPNYIKLLVFFIPFIFMLFYWSMTFYFFGGFTTKNINTFFEDFSIEITYPADSVCGLIPHCFYRLGDVGFTDPILYPISFIIIYVTWYIVAFIIGNMINPIYERIKNWFSIKLKLGRFSVIILLLMIILLIILLSWFTFRYNFYYSIKGII